MTRPLIKIEKKDGVIHLRTKQIGFTIERVRCLRTRCQRIGGEERETKRDSVCVCVFIRMCTCIRVCT